MLRSMYSGISGMKANQTKLDVIGNNIANVGTTAFKSSTARFQDMLSQSVKDSMAPNANQGGVNSAQVGLGVKLASIDSVMKQGNLQPTGRALDMAIDGDGFFMVSKGSSVFGDNQLQVNQRAGAHNITAQSLTNSGAQLMYSRDGAFSLDEQGNLITADGYRVMGYSLTNDDTSVAASSVAPNKVNLNGLDIKFGPGSALNGYKVVVGEIGPQTVTSAEVDKNNKQIVLSGDFATAGALTAPQVESAINKALNSAGIAQSVFVAGKPDVINKLASDKAVGGLDDAAPGNVTAAGLTFQFGNGKELEGYSIEFDKIGPGTTTDATITKNPNKIIINADLVNGNVSNTELLTVINDKLNAAGITQAVEKITGSPTSLSQISAKTDSLGSNKAVPTLTDDSGVPIATLGGLTFNFQEGGKLNDYTIKFGNNGSGVAPSVTIDKSNMVVTINGDLSVAANVSNLATLYNNELAKNNVTSPKLTSVTGTYSGLVNQVGKIANGKDDSKPSDITVANLKLSFPIGSTYNGYTFQVVDVKANSVTAECDPTQKVIKITGDFLTPNSVSSAQLQQAIKDAVIANPPAGVTLGNYDTTYKITVGNGTGKTYSNLVSNQISGGSEKVAPQIASDVLGLSFAAGTGAALNGYSVQVGTVTQGTKPSVDVDTTNKKIVINGDLVTPGVTVERLNREIQNALENAQINQTLVASGTIRPLTSSQSASDISEGGTPVQSLDQNGAVTFVDGTKTVKAYDGSLKTLRIPEKVKIPGTDTELRIKSYTIDKNGIINGVLEDGKVAALGQVAMAGFKNASGLTKLGGNLYAQSVNSGEATIKSGSNTRDDDNSKGFGDALQGMLEMSNVDLAEQFTDMITATRAFQASSKMINTGDEILQDIINLKR
ncbi:flagellar hook-basal body complex protein [Clostridium sp. YIM B02505]|uniref:Flagellar hook protein FlgE n=1 Tax=Clostridium yunnanense TaxID=2800325 RepID=A0ABS1EU61_9CLOT|nr:flagellar hook-basal body complex protein [Clostridium yunnanense]MBK1812917.1 flagellar hook-basal body complex protein [Clostridium yunnanense]